MYRRSYLPHLQDPAADHQKNIGFGVADPMMGISLNAINSSATNGPFSQQKSAPTLIPEPRISVVQVPELPLFFSQSQNFFNNEIPLQPINSHYNDECQLKSIKNRFPSPSPLQLQPSPMLEKVPRHSMSNRSNSYTNGIMSENVQQRYLFSKNPNYGPLSIPVTTTYHPPMGNARQVQGSGFFGCEESQNYNYNIRSFGRRSIDAREPMPKLGQGDARLGNGILFGERKAGNRSNFEDRVSGFHPTVTCKVLASPPSLTYSAYSPKPPISSHRPHTDPSRLGLRNIRPKSPQRSAVPIPIGPVPEKSKRKPLEQPQTPSRTEKDHKSYTQEGRSKHQISQMLINEATSLPVQADVETVPGVTTKPIPTGPKKMASNYQLSATAAEFQPASRRARPSKWKVQCKWASECVKNCRFGNTCHWGHEGDEYIDTPGVKYTFKKNGFNGNINNEKADGETCHGQTRYEQNQHDQYNPSEYSTSGYPIEQDSDYGVHQRTDSRMPNFSSWVGGATSVGCQSMNNYPVYDYIDTQFQNPTILYEGSVSYDEANVYRNTHTQSQSETLDSLTESTRRKKHNKKKTIIKPRGDKMKEEASLVGKEIEENFQGPHVKDASHEKENEPIKKKLQGLHVEDAKFDKRAAEITVDTLIF